MQTRTLNDRYRLDELVGEGGMAVVYRGYDLVLNREVAVKLLRDQYGSDENFLARFDREAQSAARLAHPNVVNVYDVGEDGKVRYIIMEHIDGPNLKELIRRQGPFTVDGAAFIIRQIANGLDYAHARGLVHRDIKPQNILVDNNGNVKVVDFGIAKGMSDSNLTEAGTGMGTVHYVSPEQARGEQATPMSDVYSTGVVLYEMLTRTIPFDADSPVGVAMQHVSAAPPPPTSINPQLPPEIDQFIEIALAKDPAVRFSSAGELASALESLSRGEAIGGTAATRMMTSGAAATAVAPAGARATRKRGGRGRTNEGRIGNFRDDVGCVTWLIGSAILIGLLGLVILAFRLGDFGLFEPSAGEVADATPTATAEASPTVSPTPELTATMEATPVISPTPEPSPTPQVEEDEFVLVPVFVGGTLDQARTAAGDLQLEVEEVFSNDYGEGIIASQDPAPETEVESNATVIVRVSRGSETFNVPNLANRSRGGALAELNELPVNVQERQEPSRNIQEGTVIRNEPTGPVSRGTTVTIYISMGDVVRVPNVYRQPLQDAINEIEAAGLQVNSASPQSCEYIQGQDASFDCESFPDGYIVSGTPHGWDEWVTRGSTMDIAYFVAESESDD